MPTRTGWSTGTSSRRTSCSSNGHALVADFGIAKAVEAAGDSKLTETGWGMGTPAYMSPEQIVGEPVDGRSDIYGLGCVVYEMLTGHPPFPADNARAMFTRHQVDPPPPISAERPEIPAHVQDAVLTALAKLPGDRFTTASEFIERLTMPGGARAAAAVVSDPGGTPLSATGADRLGCRRAPARRWLGLPRGHPAAIGGGHGSSVAVLPIADLGGDTSQAYVAAGLTEQLITDLAQSRDLRVINRLTMEKYAQERETPREIARGPGVDAVRHGQPAADRRQRPLHRAADPEGIRPGSLGRELRRYPGRSAADPAGDRLDGGGAAPGRRVQRGPPAGRGDPDAIDAYVRGRYWWGKRNGPSLLQGHPVLRAGARRRPSLRAGLRRHGRRLYPARLPEPASRPNDAFPKAAAAARKALELDSTLAEPHATLAFYQFLLRLGLEGGRAGVPGRHREEPQLRHGARVVRICSWRRWAALTEPSPRRGGPRRWTRCPRASRHHRVGAALQSPAG